MDTVCLTETLVTNYESTRRYNQDIVKIQTSFNVRRQSWTLPFTRRSGLLCSLSVLWEDRERNKEDEVEDKQKEKRTKQMMTQNEHHASWSYFVIICIVRTDWRVMKTAFNFVSEFIYYTKQR